MINAQNIFQGRRVLVVLYLVLSAGFFATTLSGYFVSKQAIRESIIGSELPLTSSNIYSEIQRDLVRPILISSTMASDTFVREWVLRGERDPAAMSRYLQEVKARYGAFSSFFVSDRSSVYYTGEGILKKVSPNEARDAWYYRVRELAEPYEINVDPDLANKDALTIFINYRVFDFNGKYLGATGIGLTVDAVRRLIADYQQRFERTIYFVDASGEIVLFGDTTHRPHQKVSEIDGLNDLMPRIYREKRGSFAYEGDGKRRLLNVNYLPELKWYLFVEKDEDDALADIRRALVINLAACLLVTLVVLGLTHLTLERYQRRIEEMATTDKLTGLLNRQVFELLIGKMRSEIRRDGVPVTLLLADVDRFKEINDRFGHAVGDRVLSAVAEHIRRRVRDSDLAFRWGGEEFLMVLKNCPIDEATRLAESLCKDIATSAFADAGSPVKVTISLGVAAYDGLEAIEKAIARADAGMYAAKAAGRNAVRQGPAEAPVSA